MIEVLRTNDPVRLSFALALLSDAGCEAFVADGFIASVEGSIGAFPRRVLVAERDEARARAALRPLDHAGPPGPEPTEE